MDKNYILQLTFLVYRITEDWPEAVFLKTQFRHLVNQILNDFILVSNGFKILREQALRNISVLQGYLVEARNKKLISRDEFLLLKQEYCKISEYFKKPLQQVEKDQPEKEKVLKKNSSPKEKKKQIPQNNINLDNLNQRQRKILDILSDRENVQVWQLKELFSEVSKRTLRRDLESLVEKNMIKRQGEWNEISYMLFNDKT